MKEKNRINGINEMGCERFARETGQELMTFYSIDKLGTETENDGLTKKQRKKNRNFAKNCNCSAGVDSYLCTDMLCGGVLKRVLEYDETE